MRRIYHSVTLHCFATQLKTAANKQGSSDWLKTVTLFMYLVNKDVGEMAPSDTPA